MALLYADENFPKEVVELLRTMGHDVLTTLEAGNAGQAIPDSDVLAFAVRTKRTVLTLNRRDFIRLHQDTPDHAGIVVWTQDSDLEGQAKRIHEALSSEGDLADRLIRVNRPLR
jgi:hypothetical protein